MESRSNIRIEACAGPQGSSHHLPGGRLGFRKRRQRGSFRQFHARAATRPGPSAHFESIPNHMKSKNKPLILLISWIALAFIPHQSAQVAGGSSAGQAVSTGVVEGRVFNPATGEFVSNAEVSVGGTALLATTSVEGRYRLANVPSGNVTLTVRYAGYPTATASMVVAPGGSVTRDFEMQSESSDARRQVVQMGAVTVEAVREGMAKALMEQRSSLIRIARCWET